MKLINIVNASMALVEMGNLDVSGDVAFKIIRLTSNLQKVVEDFDKVKNEVIKKYGEIDDKGNITVQADSEKYIECMSEINNVLQNDVELSSYKKLKASYFKDIKIKPDLFKALGTDFIEDDLIEEE
jgi:hypothetical protein